MKLNTAAAVISHMANLEQASAEFYERWAPRLPRAEDRLRALAKENRKNGVRIRQVYYDSVTDALETAFSFPGITADIEIPAPGPTTPPGEVLHAALRLENEIQAFYESAAASSRVLLADVSRVMTRLAQRRGPRRAEIQSALQSF
jgi:rubrerythrin